MPILGSDLLKHGSGVGPPALMTIISGSGQSATCGSAYALPLVVIVVDVSLHPVPSVSVTFTAPASGASGTFASTGTRAETVVTGADGKATSSIFTANTTPGTNFAVSATASALTCTFSLISLTYQSLMTSTFASNVLIALWPLTETTGTNAADTSGNTSRDGTYSAVTLNNITGPGATMGNAPRWDGTQGLVNIFSASLAGAFSHEEGTFSIFIYLGELWNVVTARVALMLTGDSANFMGLNKQNGTTLLAYQYRNTNTDGNNISTSGLAINTWYSLIFTWSKSNNRVRTFLNAIQQGADAPATGTFTPALSAGNIGRNQIGANQWWKGGLAWVALLNREADPTTEVPILAGQRFRP